MFGTMPPRLRHVGAGEDWPVEVQRWKGGIVWCGAVWCDVMVWCGVMRCDVLWCGVVGC